MLEEFIFQSQGNKQQWGNAGNSGGSVDVTFPISFTKTVYQIQLTYNNSSYENPTYEIKDTKSFSYWSKYGGDKLWLAIGVQQWGYTSSGTLTFPIAFNDAVYACTSTMYSPNDIGTEKYYGYLHKLTNKDVSVVKGIWEIFIIAVGKQLSANGKPYRCSHPAIFHSLDIKRCSGNISCKPICHI